MKPTVADLGQIAGKTVLVRVDYNVPMAGTTVTDDSRIRQTLPTLRKLIAAGAKLVLCAHMGRPQKKDPSEWGKLSLKPAADVLAELLGQPVAFAANCIGPEAEAAKAALEPGSVLLLENTRFHRGEESKDAEERRAFAKELAKGCDAFVQDAFGAVHRAHGSTTGVVEFLKPAVLGDLVERELKVLTELRDQPERPLVVILGGAKVADKLGVVQSMMNLADTLIIGGGMAYTFFKARGLEIGLSLLDADSLDAVKEIEKTAAEKGVKLLLPVDIVVAPEFKADSPTTVVAIDQIPADQEGMDIGPETRRLYAAALQGAKMVFWNGPMGVFEFDAFAQGTNAVARALADCGAKVVVGGGDSGAAVKKAGVADRMYHNCTGGGASLEFLEGHLLPGIEAIV
ncbi:MAG: phosphoglycerate kinase [Armatimonadetes bacterium]|nr:phosphoglycerate kinase [Armatimonadota bacterium]